MARRAEVFPPVCPADASLRLRRKATRPPRLQPQGTMQFQKVMTSSAERRVCLVPLLPDLCWFWRARCTITVPGLFPLSALRSQESALSKECPIISAAPALLFSPSDERGNCRGYVLRGSRSLSVPLERSIVAPLPGHTSPPTHFFYETGPIL